MTRIFGLIVAGGLVMGLASDANAQLSISVGNPYSGQGVTLGGGGLSYNPGYVYAPQGYGNSYLGNSYYGRAYGSPYNYGSGYVAPGTTYYSSGYRGITSSNYGTYNYARPYGGYSNYASPYGGYSNYGSPYGGYSNYGSPYGGSGVYLNTPVGSMRLR